MYPLDIDQIEGAVKRKQVVWVWIDFVRPGKNVFVVRDGRNCFVTKFIGSLREEEF